MATEQLYAYYYQGALFRDDLSSLDDDRLLSALVAVSSDQPDLCRCQIIIFIILIVFIWYIYHTVLFDNNPAAGARCADHHEWIARNPRSRASMHASRAAAPPPAAAAPGLGETCCGMHSRPVWQKRVLRAAEQYLKTFC
eukprot:6201087-Pleurochrysis_carterae.AAC.2